MPKIKKVAGEDYITNAMMSYSAEVLLNRAIPVLQDGLKPAYRQILISMFLKKEFHLTKSANVSGEVMRIHPHGSVYGTMVNMVQKDRNLIPLLDGNDGNFGEYTSRDIQEAADRYTEVRLTDFAKSQLVNYGKNTVEMIPTYDGATTIPRVIPVTFPLILLYATQGVGVGYASQTLSFNMKDVANLINNLIVNHEKTIIYPDFATGAYINKKSSGIEQIMETGHGRIDLRAKISKIDSGLMVTEIPYGEKRENIIDKIVAVHQQGKLSEIKNVKDLTDRKGFKIKIETYKNANLDDLIQKLYKYTSLQTSITANMNIIDIETGIPKVMGVYEICKRWLKWRLNCVKKELVNNINQYQAKLEILDGYSIILSKLDDVIKIIRSSKKSELVKNLMSFGLNKNQVKSILNIRLYNLNHTIIEEKISEIDAIKNKIANNKNLLNNDDLIFKKINYEITELANKFSPDRKTQIVEFDNSKMRNVIKKEVENDNSEYYVTITSNGLFLKKKSDEVKLLPGVNCIFHKKLVNNSVVNILCNNRYCYGVRLNEIKELDTLIPISKICDYNEKDKILAVFNQNENSKNDKIIFGYSNGKMVKVSTSSYPIKSRKIKNAFADEELNFVYVLNEDEEISIHVKSESNEKNISSIDIPEKKSRISVGKFVISKNRNVDINTKYEVIENG